MIIAFLANTSIQSQKFSKANTFKLSEPQVVVDSLLFVHSATFTAKKGESGSEIFVQRNGEKALYVEPFSVEESAEISFWAEHPDFQSSEVKRMRTVKISDGLQKAKLKIEPQPNSNYAGDGWQTLVDLKKGSTNFRNGKKWLGFQKDKIHIKLELARPIKISEVVLGVLKDHGSWIFLPSRIEVRIEGHKLIGETEIETPISAEESISTFISVPIHENEYEYLDIIVYGLGEIPTWHQGKGTTPWIFIDELLIKP